MLDWMTLTLEAIGILIFCIWIVLPVREFRTILRRLREQRTSQAFPVVEEQDAEELSAGK